jgi:mRNA-degrading endonuclease RelE of RelBE toxin-antitoxin system
MKNKSVPFLHKVRIQNTDIQKGKRSGYRCIYYLKAKDSIVLITIYSKLDQSDVSAKRIKEILKEMNEKDIPA